MGNWQLHFNFHGLDLKLGIPELFFQFSTYFNSMHLNICVITGTPLTACVLQHKIWPEMDAMLSCQGLWLCELDTRRWTLFVHEISVAVIKGKSLLKKLLRLQKICLNSWLASWSSWNIELNLCSGAQTALAAPLAKPQHGKLEVQDLNMSWLHIFSHEGYFWGLIQNESPLSPPGWSLA